MQFEHLKEGNSISFSRFTTSMIDQQLAPGVKDADQILAAAERFLRVFDDLDRERFVVCWSSDPTAFFPGETVRLDGRAAVLARFRIMFDQVPLRASDPPYLHLKPQNLRSH